MLIRPQDADDDSARWRAFLAAQGFGHFVASGIGHETPVVVPTQFVLTDDALVFHLAVTNPVFSRLEESAHSVMSVAGDWTYIPGSWKAIDDEDPALGIPTTYYAAVQVTGEVELLTDADGVADVLRTQLAGLEPDGGLADPTVHGAKLRAIRGIRLPLDTVRAKYKFGGNVDDAHRRAVASRLVRRDRPGDADVLRHMRGI